MSGDIIEMIDQSVRDYDVSSDAMRWAPAGTVPAVPDPARDEFLREAICRWMTANGIDYRSVPLNSHCRILSGRKIYYEVYLRRDGKLYVDPVTGDAVRGPAVALLKVHPDCVVSSWVWLDVDYPPPLAVDGASYRRRCLARRRRRRG